MAQGSYDEVKVWLNFARDLGYMDKKVSEEVIQGYEETGKMLNGLMKSWKSG